MSLFKIAWRSIQQRGLASFLTMLSMALGVTMVVAVLSTHGVVSESFRNNASLGYGLIVGGKGGRLDLTMNTVYYLGQPGEPLKFPYFTEFLPKAKRDAEFDGSLLKSVPDAQWDDLAATATLGGIPLPGLDGIAELAAQHALRAAHLTALDLNRDGKYAQFTGLAIPLCLGDYFGRFRVIGTTPAMFAELAFGLESNQRYEFSQGRNFKTWSPEHGYFEAVVGSTVAREMKLKLGDGIAPSHGDPEGESHAQKFTVVGILAPSATPNDRGVFINIEGFFLMDDHALPIDEEPSKSTDDSSEKPESESETVAGGDAANAGRSPSDVPNPQSRLPMEQREVTSILIRAANPIVNVYLPRLINEGVEAQCVQPIRVIADLFKSIVEPVQWLLLGLTALICVVSGIGILVSIYNSMSDRRREIAVMRALGASRQTVMTVVLLEAILLALGGGAIGWLGGHALNVAAAPYIEGTTGVTLGFFDLAPPIESLELGGAEKIMGLLSPELAIIPALLVLAVFVGLLPAWEAYRTDVARSLGT